MKCVVVDDEPFALNLITDYVGRTPFLEMAAGFTNPLKALDYLMDHPCDILFLDINMPELNGMQLLDTLPRRPHIVFTTAYPEFGADSYNYNAADYLLKPVKYERFLRAVTRVREASRQDHVNAPLSAGSQPAEFILVKSGTQTHKVRTDSVLYIEGAGNYMTFHLKDKSIMSLMNMKEVLDLLPEDRFVRIHKSFIVATMHIDVIESYQVIVNKTALPIGSTYRENFLSVVSKMK
jgi:DNA-binding LytR/AlgR family response regulator